MNKQWNLKGITLLELVIAIGLIAIVTMAIYTVLQTGMRTFNANLSSSSDQGNLRSAMMQITKLEHKRTAPPTCSANSVTLTISATAHLLQVNAGSLEDNTTVLANNISALSASISGKTLTITLTGANGTKLTTQFDTN